MKCIRGSRMRILFINIGLTVNRSTEAIKLISIDLLYMVKHFFLYRYR